MSKIQSFKLIVPLHYRTGQAVSFAFGDLGISEKQGTIRSKRIVLQNSGVSSDSILAEMRLNFATNQEALAASESLNTSYTMQTLTSNLFMFGLCGSLSQCHAHLIGPPIYVLVNDQGSKSQQPSSTSTSSELKEIIAISCALGAALLLCGLFATFHWRKAAKAREQSEKYTLSDLIEAADRGKPENLQAAIASDFKLPLAFKASSSAVSVRSTGSIVGKSSRSGSTTSLSATTGMSVIEKSRTFLPDPYEPHAHTWVVDHSIKVEHASMESGSVSGMLTTGTQRHHKKSKKKTKTQHRVVDLFDGNLDVDSKDEYSLAKGPSPFVSHIEMPLAAVHKLLAREDYHNLRQNIPSIQEDSDEVENGQGVGAIEKDFEQRNSMEANSDIVAV